MVGLAAAEHAHAGGGVLGPGAEGVGRVEVLEDGLASGSRQPQRWHGERGLGRTLRLKLDEKKMANMMLILCKWNNDGGYDPSKWDTVKSLCDNVIDSVKNK